MANNSFPVNYLPQQSDPVTAALLSIVPGLGQLYNGEKRKGVLFLEVAAINYFLLWLVVWTSPLVDGVKSFGKLLNLKPNGILLGVLAQAHWGSPLSLIILGMVMMFVTYAIRDAYDRASFIRRKKIYPDQIIDLSEATSGSYLFHFAAMVTFFVLAMFFLVPKPPVAQITEITFTEAPVPTRKPVKSNLASSQNSADTGRHHPDRQIGPSGQTSSSRTATTSSATTAVNHPPMFQPRMTHVTANQPPNPQPQLSESAPRSAVTPPMPTLPRAAAAPQQALPMPSLQAPRSAGGPPAPMPTKLAFNPPSALPPVPVPGRPVQFTGPNPAPMSARTPGAGTSGNPMPRVSSGESQSQGVPAAIAPIRADNGTSTSGPTVVPSMAGTNNSARKTGGPSTSGPAPMRADSGPNGSTSNGPAIAVAPSVTGPKGPRSVSEPGQSGTGTPRENDNPRGPANTGTHNVPDFGEYMAYLQRRIKLAWVPPRGPSTKRVIVEFKIHPGGELSHLRLSQTSGDAVSDQAALKAVENCAPFRHLPQFTDEPVDIEFTFDYNVFNGSRRF